MKTSKYGNIESSYLFTTVTVETSGIFVPKTNISIRELGCHLKSVTEDNHIFQYLLQRISVDIQRENAGFVLGIVVQQSGLLDIQFSLFNYHLCNINTFVIIYIIFLNMYNDLCTRF